MVPQVHQPTNGTISAHIGESHTSKVHNATVIYCEPNIYKPQTIHDYSSETLFHKSIRAH